MAQKDFRKDRGRAAVITAILCAACLSLAGCGANGYSSASLYPDNVQSVYVEMFDNMSFWRGVEYQLSDALAKRVLADTPYRIISSRDRADTVLSGQLVSVSQSVLTTERQIGRALEKEVRLQAVVNWKNLQTGDLLIDNENVTASATYSEWQGQGFEYASAGAANNLAEKIVELMETQW